MSQPTHFNVNCYHCDKPLYQRRDTFNRQVLKYGHNCCKNCFGKEQSFRDARKDIMTNNNPFKGKTHTKETISKLATLKMGSTAWNKGLNKDTHPSIKRYGEAVSLFKLNNPLNGDKNPNWKGGISATKDYFKNFPELTEWLSFRALIIERDKECWKCEAKRWLQVHHLKSQTRYPELILDELNCIVLCKPCHLQFHKKYGRKKFDEGDFISWVNDSRDSEHKLCMC